MFAKILVAIDGGPTSDRTLDAASDLARRHHALLIVAHVLDRARLPEPEPGAPMVPGTDMRRVWRAEGEQLLEQARERLNLPGLTVETTLLDADSLAPDEQVLRAAQANAVDLIVVGTHPRHGIQRWGQTSFAEHVLHKAACSVFVVRSAY